MKKLDLNQFDVVEMKSSEVISTNGGGLGGWLLFIVDAVSDYAKGMSEGYKWASTHLN